MQRHQLRLPALRWPIGPLPLCLNSCLPPETGSHEDVVEWMRLRVGAVEFGVSLLQRRTRAREGDCSLGAVGPRCPFGCVNHEDSPAGFLFSCSAVAGPRLAWEAVQRAGAPVASLEGTTRLLALLSTDPEDGFRLLPAN